MIRKRRRYFAAHPEADLNETMEKMKRGLLAYGQGKTDVETALKKAGLSAPRAGTHTMYVMSYIGQQAALLEEQGRKYSISEKHAEKYDYEKSFAEQVEDYENGKLPKRDTLLLGRTPEILNKIGISDLPMTISQSHVDYMLNGKEAGTNDDHIFNRDTIKKLPELIADPVAVIESRTRGESSVVVVIDAKSENGKNAIAAIEINGHGILNGKNIDSNAVTSVYGKNNTLKLLKEAMEKENGVFFIKKVEAQSLMDADGVQFPASFHQDGLIHSIFDAGVSVKKKYMEQTDTRQFKRWFRGSEAVNADGTPKVFYHGTPNGTFNTFRNWQYFTENKAYADGYQNQGASSNGYKKTAENKKTYAVYLQTGKVFDTRNSAEREIFENEFYGKWGNGTPLSERGLPDWTDGDDLIEFFDENGYDYDTILLDEGGTGGYGEDVKDRGISYVIKDSSQIKSATDNVGTFDPENPDIRYSINEKNGQTQLPDVTEDAELSAQAAGDEDMRAALMLVQRLYDTARNGEGYLELNGRGAIQAGDWQKRVEGIRDRLLSETGSGYGKGALTRRLNAILC